ncbi:Conserved_hypothetical protein [Hexamita inflata]|uniref:ISXO2-like transposase domain-containing protein n=1 Tax=Hexamita inflata TaxID=28002 RepID=A0ABP1H7J8_9EUKA
MVKKRNRKTLEAEILKHILPKSTMYSDKWSSYNHIIVMKNHQGIWCRYNHFTVNHSKNFLNPVLKSIHTQNIERRWGDLNRIVKLKRIQQNTSSNVTMVCQKFAIQLKRQQNDKIQQIYFYNNFKKSKIRVGMEQPNIFTWSQQNNYFIFIYCVWMYCWIVAVECIIRLFPPTYIYSILQQFSPRF